MTIKFYDASGSLREVRLVTGKLSSLVDDMRYTGLIEQRLEPWDVIGHYPFSGGRMEIE